MMNKRLTSYIDLSLLLMMAFLVLFVLAFFHINPKALNSKDSETKDLYMIVLSWNDESSDDIDIWLGTPDNKKIGYPSQFRNQPIAYLDRDDRGLYNDTIIIDGQITEIKLNREVVGIRKDVNGEYIVNLHYFKNDLTAKQVPQNITVELIKIKPYTILYKTTLDYNLSLKQEKTIFCFEMNNGEINIITDKQIGLVE